ncbi:MAG: putative porin [Bacteroidetes bacterium]|nr:putative porin [Bacteroidota bacterium]
MNTKHIILLLLLSVSLTSFGLSPADSIIKPAKTKFRFESEIDRASTKYIVPDSSLSDIQQYRNRYNLGNIGLATTSLFFPSVQHSLGFNFAQNNFQNFIYQPHKIEYYDTRTPYTELFFMVGSKKELYSKFTHSQNVNKNLNFTANFQRMRSDGFYSRQNTNHTDFSVSGNYRSSNKRYILISNIINNSLKNAENGGISSDSVFEKLPVQDRRLLPINLSAADRKYRGRSVYLKQYVNLGPKKTQADSTQKAQVQPTSVLSHGILVHDEMFAYTDMDPTSGFYNNIYNDSVRTFDSTYIFRMENELTWRFLENKKDGTARKIGFQVGIKHQFIKIEQLCGIDTVINTLPYRLGNRKFYGEKIQNGIVNAEVYNFSKRFAFVLRGDYILDGFNSGDNSFSLHLNYNIDNSTQNIGFKGSVINRKPDNIYLNNYSNNYKWTNHFGNVSYMNAQILYKIGKYDLELGAIAHQYTNYVYFDGYNVGQESDAVQGFSGYINKTFHIRHFVFRNKITYQNIPDSSVIKLPQWVTEHSLYYENTLFKNALRFQLGVDVFYNSAYFANAWSPALGQFYLQSQKKIGNYPYVDVFLNLKISRARFFVKYENANGVLMEQTYYYVPHYPMPDFALKFGVIWRFFD